MLAHFARMVEVGTLPARRVTLRTDQRYYAYIVLPLPPKDSHYRLMSSVFVKRRDARQLVIGGGLSERDRCRDIVDPTAALADLTVLALGKVFDLIAQITGQPIERLLA